mmetsp:Transcript_24068/g.72317  ORF Transcript_24068/g.72317 Transcript_24068/m.72317 type:complete len:382 (-) Transcript_24068:8-1153(-)
MLPRGPLRERGAPLRELAHGKMPRGAPTRVCSPPRACGGHPGATGRCRDALPFPDRRSHDELLRTAIVAALVAMRLVVELGRRESLNDRPRTLFLERKRALGHAHEAHLAPVLPPRIPHNPIKALLRIGAPTRHGDDVVHPSALCLNDAGLVIQQGDRVDAASNRAARINLLHHCRRAADGPVVGDRDIGVRNQRAARAALLGKASASPRHVNGFARGVHVRAEPLIGIKRARQIRLAGLVAQPRAFQGKLVQPLVGPIQRTAVASPHATAIEEVLDGRRDVDALRAAGDLDAVRERRDRAVGPAGPTILRDVLVPRDRAIVDTVLVAPIELVGEVPRRLPQELIVRVRRVSAPRDAERLRLAPAEELVAAGAGAAGNLPL